MKVIFSIALFTFVSLNFTSLAQDSIPEKKKKSKEEKNLRFSILGGPGYTPDLGFLIGGSAIFTFSTDTQDSTMKRSIAPLSFAYFFEGGGNIRSRPQIFFAQDKMRLFGEISFNDNLENYYGIGYQTNKNRPRSKDSTLYRNVGYKINPIFFYRWPKSRLFVGGSIDLLYDNITTPSEGVYKDKNFIDSGGDSLGLKNFNYGLGLNLSYDTRDLPYNAFKGLNFEASAVYYPKIFNATTEFSTVNLRYSQYKHLGAKRVLAWIWSGRFNFGNPTLTEMSSVGSPFDLRGYYLGQFRDKNASYLIAEYRQLINFGDHTKFLRFMSRFGFAAWGGMGFIGSDALDWSPWLPNYGAGLRVEVQPKMNFRLDFGVDPINGQMLVYFNMTEAF